MKKFNLTFDPMLILIFLKLIVVAANIKTKAVTAKIDSENLTDIIDLISVDSLVYLSDCSTIETLTIIVPVDADIPSNINISRETSRAIEDIFYIFTITESYRLSDNGPGYYKFFEYRKNGITKIVCFKDRNIIYIPYIDILKQKCIEMYIHNGMIHTHAADISKAHLDIFEDTNKRADFQKPENIYEAMSAFQCDKSFMSKIMRVCAIHIWHLLN